MRGFRNCLVALLAGMAAPLLIWVGFIVAMYQRHKQVAVVGAPLLPGVKSSAR